jgi:hypothetical protein
VPDDSLLEFDDQREQHSTFSAQALDQVSLVRTPESCLINGAYRGPIPGALATDDRFVRWKHASDFSVT